MTDNETKTRTVRTVYLICHKGSEIGKDTYVGSTSLSLNKRLSARRSNASRPGNEENKFYKRMRDVGLRSWVIRPLLSLECTICSSDDLLKWESMLCKILRSDLNSKLPIRLGKKKSGPTVQTVYMVHNRNSKTGKDTYVRSTSQTLSKRLADHRSNAFRPGNEENKFYKRMREVGLENWEIVLLLTLECTPKEIRALERGWCETLEADLNTSLPIRTKEEALAYWVRYRKSVKLSAKHRCEVCNLNFESGKDQRKHNETLKHQYAFLNSLD